jgi:glycosyltransferase involved in cell wall biosynthesis
VYELATHLSPTTYDVVVAFGGNGALKQKLEAAGIRTHTIESFERDIDLIKELRSMKEIYTLIKKECPQIVHLNSSKAGGSGALIARLCGIKKIIFTAHGWPFFEDRSILWKIVVWFFSWLTALLAHTVIVVSENDYRAFMPFVKRKFRMIRTAVPDIDFKERNDARIALSLPAAEHRDDIWAVANSELTHNKNLFVLLEGIELFNKRSDRKAFLTLISDGELRHKLEIYVKERQLQNMVFFTGYVPDARTYLKAFDVFVMPSLKEGMPYALLEAGAAGLTCIASNVGGIPEVIEHSKNGYLIDPKKPEDIVAALQDYVAHPEKHLGTLLEDKVRSTFNLTGMLEKTTALYEENGSLAS